MLQTAVGTGRIGHGMSTASQGPGWWLASDGKWYPPELWTGPSATQRAASGAGNPYARSGELAPAKTNGLAIAALICGCVGFLLFIPGILGIIFGFIARGQIKRSNGQQKGEGMALAGIIVGTAWLAFLVVSIALGAARNHHGNSGVVNSVILLGHLGLVHLFT
jgi:Domain of unknown function (DUF4190)